MDRDRIAAVALLFVVASLSVNFISLGNSGPEVLFDLSHGARKRAMGKIGVGLAGGGSKFPRNPALIRDKVKPALHSLYSRPFDKYSHYNFSFGFRGFRASYTGLTAGNIVERDLYGDPTGTSFSYSSHGIVAGVGGEIRNVGLGIKGKGFYSSTRDQQFLYSLTPGLAYSWKPFRFGAAFTNLLSSPKTLDQESGYWDRRLAFGFGFVTDDLRIGVDLETEIGEGKFGVGLYRAGIEWWARDYLALRGGFNGNREKSFGFGFRGGNIRIDYAYTFHDQLPDSYAVSLGWVFG